MCLSNSYTIYVSVKHDNLLHKIMLIILIILCNKLLCVIEKYILYELGKHVGMTTVKMQWRTFRVNRVHAKLVASPVYLERICFSISQEKVRDEIWRGTWNALCVPHASNVRRSWAEEAEERARHNIARRAFSNSPPPTPVLVSPSVGKLCFAYHVVFFFLLLLLTHAHSAAASVRCTDKLFQFCARPVHVVQF